MITIEDILEDSKRLFFDQFYNPIMITTALLEGEHPKILYINDAMCEMSGYSKDELLGKTPRILQGEKTNKEELARVKDLLKRNEYYEGENVNYTKDGREYWVQFNISAIKDKENKTTAFISCQKDITLKHLFFQHSKIFQRAIDQSRDEIAIFDTDAKFVYANPSYVNRTGYSLSQLLGKKPSILKSGLHDQKYYKLLWSTLQKGESFKALFHNKGANGEIYHEMQTITPIKEAGDLLGFVSIGKNYDSEHKLNSNLIVKSRTDKLTGIYNREYLEVKLKDAIHDYHNNSIPFCMIFVDLDNFKNVNDKEGHEVGDSVLKSIAALLKASIRKSDDIFRYGGDEFVFLLYDIKEDLATKVLEKLNKKLYESEFSTKYGVGISIGLSEYNGEHIQDFFKLTDKKMYDEKIKHKNSSK